MVLKKREEKILKLICKQMTNQEIAECLERDVKTIESVISELLVKTKSFNRVGLAMYAVKNNIVRVRLKNV